MSSSHEENQQYLQKNVRGILQPMVSAVLLEKPNDPILFMIQWLQNYAGIKSTGENIEQAELENLRKEVKHYKKKYEKEDKEMEVSSESEEDLRPKKKKKIDEEMKKRQKKKKGMRQSVSAEVYGTHNVKKEYVPRVIPKSDEQKERIKEKCLQSFIFNSLDEAELKTVIDSFEEKNYKVGDVVIKQGDEGDVLYLVDTGELDCEKVFKAGDPPTFLKTYKPGESFGELALLYNAPRAATIKAKTDALLWALDRECFNNIVKDAAMRKREKYEDTLKKVEILQTIDPYELGQICDALKPESITAGTKIITQNEEGDKFYILDEGEAHAEKVLEPGKQPENVMKYESGGYFGELALLKNEPRAATVVADTDCKVLTLDRMAFKRLLGPLENLLQRNSEAYVKYMKK